MVYSSVLIVSFIDAFSMIIVSIQLQTTNVQVIYFDTSSEYQKQWGPHDTSCNIKSLPEEYQHMKANAFYPSIIQSVQCNWDHPFPTHGDILTIDIGSQSGGYKIYKDSSSQENTHYYKTFTNTFHFEVTFDLELPENCMITKTCPPEKPYPCDVLPDVSKV